MSEPGPRGQLPDQQQPAVSAAESRAAKFTPANMVRSLVPLTAIMLVVVGVTALRQNPEDPVREVDPGPSIALAAERAGYPLLVPQGLPDGWRPTSARTDAVSGAPGDPVTLQIGWLTPAEEYAGFVISDGEDVDPLDDVLDDSTDDGTAQIGGRTWERRTTERGETALTRTEGEATLLVTGSAPDAELEALATAVAPHRAP